MSNQRKLQGEIDKVLKKVAEGVEVFEDVWQKVHTATNANQKEKYEADLKKEIKKLQRLRDQIKTWLASSDIKDKKQLMENRKLIEQQMERFKVVERETKTKAYSKEGLGQPMKKDRATKEREELRYWLTDCIERLNQEVDQFESEVESIHSSTKKKKLDRDRQDRVEELQRWIERHQFHVGKLETIMRMWDNCSLETDQVKELQDNVTYYVDSSQEPDFLEDEAMYDDLQIDDVSAVGLPHANAMHEEDGPLSPAGKLATTPMKSTSQELFDERRRGRMDSTSSDITQSPRKSSAKTAPSSQSTQLPSPPATTMPTATTTTTTTTGSSSKHQGPTKSATSTALKHPTPSSTTVANGPLSLPSSTSAKSNVASSQPPPPPRPSGPAYAAAASGHVLSAWGSGSPLISGPSSQHHQTQNSQTNAVVSSSSSTAATQELTSPQKDQHHPSQRPSSPLRVGQQDALTNHQFSSASQSKGHERSSSAGSLSQSLSDHLNSSPQASLPSPLDSTNPELRSLHNSVPGTPLPAQGITGTTGSSSALTVETTFAQQSPQPSLSSQEDESPESYSSPATSTCVSNGQSSSSSPRQSLAGQHSAQSSQPDLPPSQLIFPSSIASNFQPPADLAVFSSQQQPSLPSPVGMSGSPVQNVSAPLSVMTTLSGTFSSAPPSVPSPIEGEGVHPASVLKSAAMSVSGTLSLGDSAPVSSSLQLDVSKLRRGGLLNAAVESATSRHPAELSSTVPSSDIFQQPLNPLLGVTPLGPVTLTGDHVHQLRLLEAASRHLPLASDSERVRNYLQRNPYPSQPHHCQHPPPHMDSCESFQRLSTETLFFIFYYMEGTKAQYLAAKALKKQSWRFHTKYLMWFQRHEEPKSITDEYEMGTYIYFDYEKWAQRKKEGFTFEYRFLEDKELP